MHCRQLTPLAFGLLVAACGDNSPPPTNALVGGWSVRYDNPEDASAPDAGRLEGMPSRYLKHADGLEVTQGPNCTVWQDELTTKGDFRLTLDVHQMESAFHPHGAGLVFGGTDVHGPKQRYAYFLVRGDRHFLIKTRNGDDTGDVVKWTEHEAISPEDQEFVARNVLAVEHEGEELRFFVNDELVHRCEAGAIPVDGKVGVRLVHDLRIRFRGPRLEQR